jgi:hypothetical protein
MAALRVAAAVLLTALATATAALATATGQPAQLLLYSGVHVETALDLWALAQHMAATRDVAVTFVAPDGLAHLLQHTTWAHSTSASLAHDSQANAQQGGAPSHDQQCDAEPGRDASSAGEATDCALPNAALPGAPPSPPLEPPGSLTVRFFPSPAADDLAEGGAPPKPGRTPPLPSASSALTSQLRFRLASCASLLQNRTLLAALKASLAASPRAALLGPLVDPCGPLLADRLRLAARAAYDDGGATSLTWGVLLRLVSHDLA